MTSSHAPLLFGLAIFLLAGLALWHAVSLRRRSGLPAGSVIYTDEGPWSPGEEILYDDGNRLLGKPDYLIEASDGCIIPVEVKSRKAPAEPYESHVLQLAAYCRLVDVSYGVRPTHGILHYSDAAFAVDYTSELEQDLLDLIAEMRQDRQAIDVHRDHRDWRRCSGCGVRGECDERLG